MPVELQSSPFPKGDKSPVTTPIFNVRPSPIAGEAWVGYLIRFSEANGLADMRGLLRPLARFKSTDFPQDPPALLEWLSVPSGPWCKQVQPVAHEQVSGKLPDPDSDGEYSRYYRVCPACLKDDAIPYVRSLWTHPMRLTCKSHQTMLIDACPGCGKHLDWLQSSVQRCTCGHRLSDETPMPAPGWAHRLEGLFPEAPFEWMGATFARSSGLDCLAAHVLSWLMSPADPHSGKRPRMGGLANSFLRAALAKAAADWGSKWPAALPDELIHQFNPRSTVGRRRMRTNLGSLQFSAMRELIKLVDRRLAALEADSARRACATDGVKQLTYIGPQHLSVVTAMSKRRVISAVKAGQLTGAKLIKIGSRKKLDVRVSYDAYLAIQRLFAESLSYQETCKQLQLSWRGVRQLIEKGHLVPLALTMTGGLPRFLMRDVQLLEGRTDVLREAGIDRFKVEAANDVAMKPGSNAGASAARSAGAYS